MTVNYKLLLKEAIELLKQSPSTNHTTNGQPGWCPCESCSFTRAKNNFRDKHKFAIWEADKLPEAAESAAEINPFTEYTVSLDNALFELPDVMVHVEESGEIVRAYTYKKDVEKVDEYSEKPFPEKFLAAPSLNPLFVNLSQAFIEKYNYKLKAAVKREIKNEKRNK